MASNMSAAPAARPHTQVNGRFSPSPADEEDFYAQILRLRAAVIAGEHPHIKLPPSAIERLKASSTVSGTEGQPLLNGASMNSTSVPINDHEQQRPSLTYPPSNGLPGLHAGPPPVANGYGANSSYAGLNPIFLQKSDHLVREEGKLRRLRIERDLQAQVEHRKHTVRDREPVIEGPLRVDVDGVLQAAFVRVRPLSGLKAERKTTSAASTSFDENDYYSSQVQSEWSYDASPSKGSDTGIGAFPVDPSHVNSTPLSAPIDSVAFAESSISANKRAPLVTAMPQPPNQLTPSSANEPGQSHGVDDEDDEYTPPDAAAFESFQEDGTGADLQQGTAAEDENSDYEPGEITQDSTAATPYHWSHQAAPSSPRVPVIRNHLTHIAAPQPNRVSPLATAKGPSIELELVNGRPEVVRKSQTQHRSVPVPSRLSSASPSANGGSGKKRRNKKRKRENEPAKSAKKQRDRPGAARSPVSLAEQDLHIKNEPISPPPYGSLAEIPQYHSQKPTPYKPVEIDLASPRHVPGQLQYAYETPPSALRYEYAPSAHSASPRTGRVVSPGFLPIHRDTQDLRRVASLHHYAQRPASPTTQVYSPAGPHHGVHYSYQQPASSSAAAEVHGTRRYDEALEPERGHYVQGEQQLSHSRMQDYQDTYLSRAQSPAPMPPLPRRVVVDQFGNRYYASEPVPVPVPALPRASAAPIDRRSQPEPMHERAPSRPPIAYAQPGAASYYEQANARPVPAPPSTHRRYAAPGQPTMYTDYVGGRAGESGPRPMQETPYSEVATSPVYQQASHYNHMPPPLAPPPREQTSPVFAPPPPSRAYSVRPEDFPQQRGALSGQLRQASVAPVQYFRQELMAPPQSQPAMRAVSVVPGTEYGASQQQNWTYGHVAPGSQTVKYVDQFGQEVYPQEVRHASEFRY